MRTAEDLLRRLLEDHFNPSCAEFHWSYIEGTSLAEVDPDLARDLDEWLSAQKNPTNGIA